MASKMSELWRLSIWNTAGNPTIQEVSIQGSSAITKNSWRWFSDPNAQLPFTVHSCNVAMSLYCIKIRSVLFTWHCPLLVVKVQQIMSTGHILSHSQHVWWGSGDEDTHPMSTQTFLHMKDCIKSSPFRLLFTIRDCIVFHNPGKQLGIL